MRPRPPIITKCIASAASDGYKGQGGYGEHWAWTELGGRLETEITKLVGSENEKANRLQRAEQLLAEIYHAVNNDGGLYPIGPASALVARFGDYLYPAP